MEALNAIDNPIAKIVAEFIKEHPELERYLKVTSEDIIINRIPTRLRLELTQRFLNSGCVQNVLHLNYKK